METLNKAILSSSTSSGISWGLYLSKMLMEIARGKAMI